MRRPVLLLTLLAFLSPISAPAHPGMTDRYDGHKCFKKCEDWGILYAEYHLHDKDRKPVRVAKKRKQAPQEETGKGMVPVEAAVQPQAAPAEVVRQVVIVREQGIVGIDPFMLILLVLLFLWLILRMSRKKEEQEARR
jgi:hypothetical protein